MTIAPLSFLLLLTMADGEKPLPNATELRKRALENMRLAADALEKYSCSVRTQQQQVDDKGQVKETKSENVDRFFVNGVQINHVIAKNGKPLSGGDASKEQKRVDKEVEKFSKPEEANKVQDRRERQFDMFLRAQKLLHGQRETRGGRSTVSYDLVSDEKFRPKTIEERFAQAIGGRVWIDEESGAPVELKIETTRDVKIGGGLLANVHKGFILHLMRARQPDGLWMTRMVEGNADVRAGLFFHPRIRFSEQTSSCQLFSVDSKDVTHSSPDGPR